MKLTSKALSTLVVVSVALSSRVVEAGLDKCTKQEECLTRTVTEVVKDSCSSSLGCEYKICVEFNENNPGCDKNDEISHACVKKTETNKCLEPAGFAKSVATETKDLASGWFECQIVKPGSKAQFLIKDGGKCNDSYEDPAGDPGVKCFPRPASIATCTGNEVGKECIWEITAPSDCPTYAAGTVNDDQTTGDQTTGDETTGDQSTDGSCQTDSDCDCTSYVDAHAELEALLPQDITFDLSAGEKNNQVDGSYFDAAFTGNSRLAGKSFNTWCVDTEHGIWYSTFHGKGYYYTHTDLWGTNIDSPEYLQELAWVLNNFRPGNTYSAPGLGSYTMSSGTVQRTAWYIIDDGQYSNPGGAYSEAWALHMYAEAMKNGKDYVPGCDDIVPIVIVPNDNARQHLVAEADFSSLGIACESTCPNEICSPRSCDNGQCVTNMAADFTACGPQPDEECYQGQVCMNGACVDGGATPSGTPCGSSETNECNLADTCDEDGVCQVNHVQDGTECGAEPAEDSCLEHDKCTMGMCTSGETKPDNSGCNLGTGCGADFCQGGVCKPGCAGGAAAASDTICEATLTFIEGKADMCSEYTGNPVNVIATTGANGEVTVTIDQVWEADDEDTGLEWIGVKRSLDGQTGVCSDFNDVKSQIEFTADCDQAGHSAYVHVFLQDKEFSGGSKVEDTDFSQCNPPDDNEKEKCYFFLDVPCECTVHTESDSQVSQPECSADDDCAALTDDCNDLKAAHAALKTVFPKTVSFSLTTDAGADSDSSFYDANFHGDMEGLQLDGWCIDVDHTIPSGTYTGTAYYFNDQRLANTNIDKPAAIDEAAWLINNYYPGIRYEKDLNGDGEISTEEIHVLTSGTLQRALWYLIDDEQAAASLGSFHDEWAKYLARDAVANGEGFMPGCFDKIPIIVVPDDGDSKHLMLEGTFQEVNIACDTTCPTPLCNINSCVDGTCMVVSANEGKVCGSGGDICKFDDTCQQGQCVPGGYAPVGYECGDSSATDCNGADSCDGFGACVDNLAETGTPCGEQQDNQCMYGGTCDGSGGCNAGEFPKPFGEECDLGNDNTKDQCDGSGTCLPKISCTYDTECLPAKKENKKCPNNNSARLFKVDAGTTLEECRQKCVDFDGCQFYSWATSLSNHHGMCMGCVNALPESHNGFDFYPVETANSCAVHECIEGFCESRVEDDGKFCGTGEANICQPSQCKAGECVTETKDNGTPCGDPGDECNSPEVCMDATCVSGAPVTTDPNDSSLPKTCDSQCNTVAKAHKMFESILPQPLTFKIEPDAGTDPDASYIDAELVGNPPLAGPTKIDGWSIGVDVAEGHQWTSGQTLEGLAFHYNDERLWNSTVTNAHRLQEAAWIINHYVPGTTLVADLTNDGVDQTEEYVLSTGTLQRAIWYLFSDSPDSYGLGQYRDEWALFIKDQAIARGQDYVPGCDAVIPVVLIPKNSENHHFILETSFQALGVQCNDQCPDEECNEYQCAVGDDGKGACQMITKADGTECGSAGDGNCVLHDQCQAGKCVTGVLAAAGTSCGSDEENECNHADTCDDEGHCLTNIEPNDTPCGDGETECKLAGSCSAGTCTYASKDNGTPCGDEEGDCINADSCEDGECVDAGFKASGATCGSQDSGLCDLPDTCDGSGNCQPNILPDDQACPGASEPVNDCWTYETCSSGQCMPSVPKAQDEPCDTGFDCAHDVCDGSGQCLLGCATGVGAASDGTSCLDDFVCASATPDGCSTSFCNDDGKCETIKAADMTDCGDSADGCTFSKCQDGVCTVQPPLDDGSECEIHCNSALKAQENLKAMLPLDFQFNLWVDAGVDSEASYIDATFKGNSPISGKKIDAWCIDVGHSINIGRDYSGKAYHFSDPFVKDTNVDDSEALDEGAWLLNHYFPGTEYTADLTNDGIDNPTSYVMSSGTLQRALWHLIDDTLSTSGLGHFRDDWAKFMANQARAFGNGFVPGCSDIVPLVAIVNGGEKQHLFVETTYAQLGITCDESCADELCNAFECQAGVCTAVPHEDDTACGKSGSDCVHRDTCQAGTCVPGVAMEVQAACGSSAVSECNAADSCDGQGLCVPNLNGVADGTLCGEEPNECQVRGTCQDGACTGPTNKPSGSTCGSTGGICVDPDHCEAGVCVAGENSPYGKLCGDTYSDECNKADICNGEGQCDANLMPDGTVCGATQTNQCINPNTCQAGSCVDGVNKTNVEPCDSGIGCDLDTCNGEGKCEVGCAHFGAAASDTGDGCTSDEECQPAEPSDHDDCREYVCSDNGVCTFEAKSADTPCGAVGEDLEYCAIQDVCDSSGNCIDKGYQPAEYLFTCGDVMYVCGRYVSPRACGETVAETYGGCEPECHSEYCDELIGILEGGTGNIFAATCDNGVLVSHYARFNCLGLDGHSYEGVCSDPDHSVETCPFESLDEVETPCGGNGFKVGRRSLRAGSKNYNST